MLNVSKTLLELFRKDLWKDSRYLETIVENGRKLIRRFADGNVSISDEHDFIQRLREKTAFKIPEIVAVADEYLAFEYIEGTRAFNLLVDLRELYRSEGLSVYRDLGIQLLRFLQDDLAEFQNVMQDDSAVDGNLKVYPVREKLDVLFQVLTGVLPYTCRFDDIRADLDAIAAVFERNAEVPFRDATPKNTILHLPVLFQNFRIRSERLEAVSRMCRNGELAARLSSENIYHIDFSGCHLLCPVIDDWIALQEHEASAWLVPASKSVSPDLAVSDLCTRFVRFSRFAGRKLAYRLLNRDGHKVRFSYDREAGYFMTLSNICRYLESLGIIDGRHLTGLMGDLFRATSTKPEKDYLLEYLPAGITRTYYSDVFPN